MSKFVSRPKVSLTGGAVSQCNLTIDTDGTYHWARGDSAPSDVHIGSLSGIDITSEYNSANSNLGTWIFCFEVASTNARVYIKKQYTSDFGSLGYSLNGGQTIQDIPFTGGSGWFSDGSCAEAYIVFGDLEGEDCYSFARLVNCNSGYWYATFSSADPSTTAAMDLIVDGAFPPAYDWNAWTILQGNGGQYRQRLTALRHDSIGDIGSANYGAQNDFIFIAPNVDMVPYARNMNYNSPVKVAWSGINWMTFEIQYEANLPATTVKGVFKLYAATSSDTVPIYQVTKYFQTGDTDHYYLSFVHDDEEMVAVFLPVFYRVGSNFVWGNTSTSDSDMLLIWQWLQASGSPDPDPAPERPYDTGTTDDGGGGGNPMPQDDIHTPNVPTLGAMTSGMFTVYCPTDAQLAQIAAYLWSDNFIDNIKKYFNNVSDNIIAFYVLPLEPAGLQTKNFKIGNLENESITGVKYLSTRFVSVDMGSIDITRRWGTYLDFAPFTKFSLYLPGVGVVALDTDDIMAPPNKDGYLSDEVGSTISLSYTIDLFTGVLVAYVYINGQIRYQFSGSIGYSVPLTGQNYVAKAQGFVTAIAGIASTIATGGTAAPFTAGAAVAGIVNASKPEVYRGGNLSGDASMLSLKTPMLIRTAPNIPGHEGLEDFTGGPSYKIGAIGDFSGFTQAIEAHIEGISCTSAERDEIMQLLKSGVII